MQNIQIFNAEQLAEKFSSMAASPTETHDTTDREAELSKLTKAELIEIILGYEAPKAHKTVNVQDIARAILQSEDCVACNYEAIAGACRILVPGAQTTSKSIASYVSKRRLDWNLPERIMIRTQKARDEEPLQVDETTDDLIGAAE